MLLDCFIVFLVNCPLLIINVFLTLNFGNYYVLLIVILKNYVHVLVALHLLNLFESFLALLAHLLELGFPFEPPLLTLHDFLQTGIFHPSLL